MRWFLPVNRHYKPLGNDTEHQAKARIKGLTDLRAERLGLKVAEHFLYLYDDATNPQASEANWRRYEAILARLMKLEVDGDVDGRRRYEPKPWSAASSVGR